MNILKYYSTLKSLFKSSCEKEHTCYEPVVFEARDNDIWQYGNVIVAYKGLAGYLVYVYELDAFGIDHPSELELRGHEGTVMCDVPVAGSLHDFLPMLFSGRSVRFASLKEDG